MTTETLTLTDFLLARIAEDEADAGEWHLGNCERNTYDAGPCDCRLPARVLSECEAKRRIIEQVERNVRDVPAGWADRILEHLALPYANHPDYRDDWRP